MKVEGVSGSINLSCRVLQAYGSTKQKVPNASRESRVAGCYAILDLRIPAVDNTAKHAIHGNLTVASKWSGPILERLQRSTMLRVQGALSRDAGSRALPASQPHLIMSKLGES